jgi:hypothetical protein
VTDVLTLGGHVRDLALQFTGSIAVPGLCGLGARDIQFDEVILHVGDERSLFGCKHGFPIIPSFSVNAPRSDSSYHNPHHRVTVLAPGG